jgi:hypothetical protein
MRGLARAAPVSFEGKLVTRKLISNRYPNFSEKPDCFLPQFNGLGKKIEINPQETGKTESRPSCAQLKQLLVARRARASFFGAHLFADPAWDILLQAYVALLEKEPLLVSTICRESVVPATTALRWISVLEQEGLLVRRHDPEGERRWWLEMSESGRNVMERYLASVWPSVLPL